MRHEARAVAQPGRRGLGVCRGVLGALPLVALLLPNCSSNVPAISDLGKGGSAESGGSKTTGSTGGGAGNAGNAGNAGSGGSKVKPTGTPLDWDCEISGEAPKYISKLGCLEDFSAFASEPMDDSIPGARSGKVVLDRADDNTLYFQNSIKYAIHYDFVSANLQGKANLSIGDKSTFDATQYTAPDADRRFMLGAVTHYEQPDLWVLELAPYDTATTSMISQLFYAVRDASYLGPVLGFHPTSDAITKVAKDLPSDIPVYSTDDIYQGIDYQPLNLGDTVGHVRILKAAELENVFVSYTDIVVLDEAPNDISVVAGLITETFQTPLSHVNVLAQNRHTPNMGLRGGTKDPKLMALDTEKDGQHDFWAKLTVGPFVWNVEKSSQEERDAWWAVNKPKPPNLPESNLEVKDLRDIEQVTEHTDSAPYVTRDAIKAAIQVFGAKAANYSVFSTDPNVPHKDGFAIPAYYYVQFMTDNHFYDKIKEYQADAAFKSDPLVRETKLTELRDAMKQAPCSEEFKTVLKEKLDADFSGKSMRFRSSTNAEDLDGFPCAGCYDSHTGKPSEFDGNQLEACLDAVRKTWATVWKYRTYEEREYNGLDHSKVAMSLLVHTNFPDEEANGVAITANPYDPTRNSPGYYVNVQYGGQYEVVAPPPGITSDSFIYQYDFAGTPVIYLTRSNVLPDGQTSVLTKTQINQLGKALGLIHTRFDKAYNPGNNAWYAMDVEFKFDDEATPGSPTLFIKQARPYPGRGK